MLIFLSLIHVYLLKTLSFTDAWEFTSHCARLETNREKPDCESSDVLYPDRCFGRSKFDAYQRDDVLSGKMELFGLNCRCYELNCTAEMAEIKFEFMESSPNPPSPNETTPTTTGECTCTARVHLAAMH